MQSFEITKREIIASISIIAILLLIGMLISSKISTNQEDKMAMYYQAVKIDKRELFQHGMDTNIGNAFVYGNLKAVDPVTYPELEDTYMSVIKAKERYTMHTKSVQDYDSDGNPSGCHTETYWTWDEVSREEKTCKKVTFLGIEFNYGEIYKPHRDYITTIHDGTDIRYVYYGSKTQYTGTLFTKLKDKTISDKSKFYANQTIEETIQKLTIKKDIIIYIFWIQWIIIIILCVFYFCYQTNQWLEQ